MDEATATAARICKLYGTLTRKGDSTPDRPHRRSGILDEPRRIEAVPIEALESLAKNAESQRSRRPHNRSARFRPGSMSRLGLYPGGSKFKGPEPYQGGRRWTLRTCPFNPEHQKPVIIQFLSGALCYKCLHNSCAQNDWKALREQVEPGYTRTDGATPGRAQAHADNTPHITDLSQIPSVWTLESHIEWCVGDMIARGSVTLICAESGTGKTWLAYCIAGCVAHGVSVLGRPVKASKVLCWTERILFTSSNSGSLILELRKRRT